MNSDILTQFAPITLDEMSGIRLMNRTDTKFVTTISKLEKLLRMALNDYRVQEVDDIRNIPYHTVYFDTDGFDMFRDHETGKGFRQKVRIRSYVNSHLDFLEVKMKNNHGRTSKKRMKLVNDDPVNPVGGISFCSQNDETVSCANFLRPYLRYAPEKLVEQVENKFNRITLVNNAKTERLTIDTALCFHNYATDRDFDLDGVAVVELKRDGLQSSPILSMLQQLRIHPFGFSKYCMGTIMTNDTLRQNTFKPKLRKVYHIMNSK